MSVEVHSLTNSPTEAWKDLSKGQEQIKIKIPPVPGKPANGKVRLVCMSDTHSMTSHIKFKIPNGDIFIHAGDFTRCGAEDEVIEFNNWIGKLPHKYKLVVAGNHELSFDPTFTHPLSPNIVRTIPTLGMERSSITNAVSTPNVKSRLTNCTYLEDEDIIIEGLKFYGTPWQPEFHGWAFNLQRGEECLKKWNMIPSDTDVLITHTPPLGHGDLCCTKVRAGCVELLNTVQKRVKPKYHIFGHIHEDYGITTDGTVVYVNASTCNLSYNPVNLPVVLDIEKPH